MPPTIPLNAIVGRYNTLRNLCGHFRERWNADQRFARKILDPQFLGEKNGRDFRTDFIDQLENQLFEGTYLEIVASFEKQMSDLIGNALGSVTQLVKKNYSAKEAFSPSVTYFLKERKTLENLSAIEELLKGAISQDLSERLAEIVDFRNHLAHGKRFGEEKKLESRERKLELEKAVATLEEVLRNIRRRP